MAEIDIAVMTAAELNAFLAEAFPLQTRQAVVQEVTSTGVRMRLPFGPEPIRPGGTISGPALMALADTTSWLAVLSRIGPEPMAVTASLQIDFLRRPAAADVVAHGELLRLGRRQAVISVRQWSEGEPRPVAHASVTYALPARPAPEPVPFWAGRERRQGDRRSEGARGGGRWAGRAGG